jgi:hypothetical protein
MTGVALYRNSYNNEHYSQLHTTVDKSLIKNYHTDLDNFLSDTNAIKLAIVEINYFNPEMTINQLDQLVGCTQVILRSIEINCWVVDILKKYDLPNFVFVLNGYLNFELQYATVDQAQYWINSTAQPYIVNWGNDVQKNLRPFDKKLFMFDVLYGRFNLHRNFVKQKLLTIDKPNWYFETPFFVEGDINHWSNLNFDLNDLWEDEIEINVDNNYLCQYRDRKMLISQVLPLKIYSKTAYSLVLETSADNRYSFFTEKIAKPIIGRRLFVVISGQHYLRNLRRLGFKTFDGIIDESYDSIDDDQTRWTKAIEQTEWLCQQPQEKILSQIAPIIIHNYAVLDNLRFSTVEQHAEVFFVKNGCANQG